MVEQYEIPQLIECFETFPSYEPELTFIVVQKRISAALYSFAANNIGTPPPGRLWNSDTLHLPVRHGKPLTRPDVYWNWPGTIRVPAPRKYAHKLAYRSGQYLHSEPSQPAFRRAILPLS
ncbi:hypothetical protein PFLUV_G00076900 [Perca fluviatilis]|uniref:Piwi domain-containing protein n=1 Tax=Perca fluviatilis TaxID=8168 RepID=A0A6A5EKD3_PERFL|nr:hypothetical protein PFLUV_G00076900 [Perca fluviatilis]